MRDVVFDETTAVWWRRPRLLAAAFCAALGVIVLALGLLLPFLPQPGEPLPPAGDDLFFAEEGQAGQAPDREAPAEAELVVYVSGAVAAPDVYRLPARARVKDAVLAAGGLAGDADAVAVNLAAPLSDAEHIHIPARGAAATSAAAPDTGGPTDGLIDVNRAGPAELEELPGVGKTLAARIVEQREANGPFRSVEALREVAGIGDKLYAQIAPLVTVDGDR